jgi:hypothetical protein
MGTTPDSRFRTGLVPYLLDLLDFIDERIREAQSDPASRKAALSEVSAALSIVNDRLRREDQKVLLTQLLLIGVFDKDLTQLATLSEDEFIINIDDLCQRHAVIRRILNSPDSSSAR